MQQMQQQIAAQQQQIGELEADNANRAAYGAMMLDTVRAQDREIQNRKGYESYVAEEINKFNEGR